jgi:SAM-dependent methyltransferase
LAYSGAEQPGAVSADRIRDYTALMAASQPMVAEEVLATYRFDRHRRVLDVGGGNGAFLRAVAAEAPRLELMLFDLPAVAEQARARFAAAGLGARATVHGGDFTQDALPQGADLITLVRVLHDHDDDVALGLLRRIRAALPPGGRLLLAEPMAGTSGRGADGRGLFRLLPAGDGAWPSAHTRRNPHHARDRRVRGKSIVVNADAAAHARGARGVRHMMPIKVSELLDSNLRHSTLTLNVLEGGPLWTPPPSC